MAVMDRPIKIARFMSVDFKIGIVKRRFAAFHHKNKPLELPQHPAGLVRRAAQTRGGGNARRGKWIGGFWWFRWGGYLFRLRQNRRIAPFAGSSNSRGNSTGMERSSLQVIFRLNFLWEGWGRPHSSWPSCRKRHLHNCQTLSAPVVATWAAC